MAGFTPGYKQRISGWDVEIQDPHHIKLTREQEVQVVTASDFKDDDVTVTYQDETRVPALTRGLVKNIFKRMHVNGSCDLARHLRDSAV